MVAQLLFEAVVSVCKFLILFLIFYRWGNKRIVLDCATLLAKQIVISHVKDIQLGKRTYHYLLSGLVNIGYLIITRIYCCNKIYEGLMNNDNFSY